MLSVNRIGNGYIVADSEDARIDFFIPFDKLESGEDLDYLFWGDFKGIAIKAISDFENNVCPACGGKLNIEEVFSAPCKKCRKIDLERGRKRIKVLQSKYKKYVFPSVYPKGYYSKWDIITFDSVRFKLNKSMLLFNRINVPRNMSWFFREQKFSNQAKMEINLEFEGNTYNTFLNFDQEAGYLFIELDNKFLLEIDNRYTDICQFLRSEERPFSVIDIIPEVIITKIQPFSFNISFLPLEKTKSNTHKDLQGTLPEQEVIISEDEYNQELTNSVMHSRKLNKDQRLQRLAGANKKPQLVKVYSMQYKRNGDVINEVLDRANGNCEYCKKPAPFLRTDGSPYLEVHHIIPLSKGGDDTVENAVALCPNCHRKAHFGIRG
jgi:hypothetical protein